MRKWGRTRHCREILELIKESGLRWFWDILYMDDGKLPKQFIGMSTLQCKGQENWEKKTDLKKSGTSRAEAQECCAKRHDWHQCVAQYSFNMGWTKGQGSLTLICLVRPQWSQPLNENGELPSEWSSAALLTRTSTRSIISGLLRRRSRVMPRVRIQYNVSSCSGTSATRRSNPLTSDTTITQIKCSELQY